MKMKKTLAILLALIMSTSVALVACNNSSDDNGDDGDFVVDWDDEDLDFDGGETEAPETDENGETIKAPENTNTNNGGSSSNTGATNMETVNDTVYVLYDANIREKASSKTSSKVLGKAPFGAALTRSAKNSAWSKVTYKTDSGATIEGYISNELVTTNKQTITFIKQETVTGEGENQTTVSVVSKFVDSSNYRLRYFPLANGYPHTVTLELGEKGQVNGTKEVTVLEISEDKMWAKIEVKAGDLNLKDSQGRYAPESTTPVYSTKVEVGYVPYKFLEISKGSNSGSSQQPGVTPVG